MVLSDFLPPIQLDLLCLLFGCGYGVYLLELNCRGTINFLHISLHANNGLAAENDQNLPIIQVFPIEVSLGNWTKKLDAIFSSLVNF